MTLKYPRQSFWGQRPIQGLAIIAIVLLGSLEGLFHHHESASNSAACSYCHAGVQTPVINLAGTLITPYSAAVGSVTPTQPSHLARIVRFSTLVPRAPPGVATHSSVFWEGLCGTCLSASLSLLACNQLTHILRRLS
jgi:hypothetical protein